MTTTHSERDIVEAAAADVFSNVGNRTMAELKDDFDALDRRLAPQLTDEGRTLLRRLSAIYRVSACIEKRRPIAECAQVLDELRAIGFSDLKEEALCLFGFARRSLESGEKARGRSALAPIAGRLRKASEAGDEESAELLRRMEPLIAALDAP